MSKDHKMTTGMTVKGTSTGRFTGRAPEPPYYLKGDDTTIVDFSTPSGSIKAEYLAVVPPGIRGKSGLRPDLVVWDDPLPDKTKMTLEEFHKQYGQEFSNVPIEERETPSNTFLFGTQEKLLTATDARELQHRMEKPMTSEEMNEGPLPQWAIGRAKGNYVLGAQLPTRDGRRCGNAHIIKVEPCKITPIGIEAAPEGSPTSLYTLLTDAGSQMEMLAAEVREQFYPPVWVSDLNDIHRKFGPQPDPQANPYCCLLAEATRGWKHNTSCENWVLKY